ncbi:TetR/AcrR family transcriptional regulator [Dyella telluris]|uniref:TetR/AcrR family transcriptional regulator n=1 Tax=Dyella telluris TaxID=2763498 RepID=A0A7G8Q3H5_9GAMM|nr:TetR/AcrR family transcriptional regulator [Dyella telluris]QNK01333.1 TetR/AcrR family transcriptional regulator [Dyella telluris]
MGRHKQFSEDDVLDIAEGLFWAKGYGATSTRDLSREAGITATSMYHAFGDKRTMFLTVLNRYLARTLHERITRIEARHPPREAIVAFLKEMARVSLGDAEHRGCMLVNSAIEATAEDADLQELVAEEMRLIETFFLRCLQAGQASGAIDRTKEPKDLARAFLAILMGMRVLARVRPEKGLIEGLVGPAITMLGTTSPN